MVDFQYKESYDVQDLDEIVRILRAPGGCPWDAEQTHQSIRRNFLEEAYEAVEAIDEGNPDHLKEELGDVLLQVLFHARMEQEAGRFDLNDVADGVCKKLIYRHPHVFGDVSVTGTGEVLSNWEELKRKEKGQATNTDALEAVARSLPALWRAEKVQKKAKKAGFDWPHIAGALDKLSEEIGELKAAVAGGTNVEEELGDLLFSAVNAARFVKVDPEAAARLHPNDHKRIVRALEVYRSTGTTLTAHNAMTRSLPPRYDALTLTLAFQRREDMWARIDRRVDQMMAGGLVDEVRALLDSGVPDRCTAMQAIGYKEMAAALRGDGDTARAAEEIKLRSRQYAKRQLTWFRRNGDARWIRWETRPNFAAALQTSTEYMEEFGIV